MDTEENYMVIGADGFVGASLVKGLRSEGYNVIQIGRKEEMLQDYYMCLEIQDVINLVIDFNVSKIFHVFYRNLDQGEQFSYEDIKAISELTETQVLEIITVADHM